MTLPSNAGSEGLVPDLGGKIPQARKPKKQYIKQKQQCNKLSKDLKKKKKKSTEQMTGKLSSKKVFRGFFQKTSHAHFTIQDHCIQLYWATHCTTPEGTLHKDYNMKEAARTKSHLPLAIPNQDHFPSPLQCSLAQTHFLYLPGTFRLLDIRRERLCTPFIYQRLACRRRIEYVLQKRKF